MINISPECLQALKDDAVQHAEIKARLINGKTLTLTDEDLILNGLEVENHAVCGEQLEIGSMTAAVLKLTLNNEDGRFNDIFFAGAELTVNLLIPLGDGTSYTISYGVYTVDEQPRTWSTIEIEAYDNMVKLDIPFDAANLSSGITMYALVDAGLESAGLSNDGSLSVFSKSTSYSLDASKIKSESPITWRQVIMWCCQCAGVCGFADGNGYIHFGFYKKYTPGILQTENAETLETENGQPILLDGASEGAFRLPPSARFIDNTSLEEADTVLTGHQFKDGDKLYPENAVMQYGLQTEGNLVFSALKNETAKIYFAKRANNAVAGFTYRPYKCNILAFPQLQLLDSIDYVLGDVYHHSIITNYTFRLNGFMNIEAKAKSQVQKGWASLGALTANQKAIIDSVSQKVDTTRDQLSSYENALLLFNEKMLRSMGLYKTAENDPNGGVILYFHDKEKLKDSGTIYMFGASGFAWTTDGWNKGDPVWHYGFTNTGDAILNTIHTYKLSAELIETGYLRSQNGASWINMDDGTFCFGSDKGTALKLENDKTLSVYGTIRNGAYSNFSASVGPSERSSDYGAFTVTDSTSGYGNLFQVYGVENSTEKGTIWTAPFLLNSAKTNRKGIAVFPHDISIFNDNYDKQTHVSCREGTVDITNSTVNLQLYRDNIMLTSYENPWVYFNYFPPEKGIAPQVYGFGNGTPGERAGIECGDIDAIGEVKCTSVNSSGYGIFNGQLTSKSVWSNGDVVAEGDITCGGSDYWEGYRLSVNGKAKANSFDVASDPDIKTNIVKQDGLKALDKVSLLNFYSYDLKKEVSESQKAHTDIGLMADEAPTEIQSADGKGIDLYAYISLTTKAVQELSKKVEALEQKISELEAENQSLRQ